MLGSPILYLKGMRILMFQLSGFYYTGCTQGDQGLRLCSGLASFSTGVATFRKSSCCEGLKKTQRLCKIVLWGGGVLRAIIPGRSVLGSVIL